MTQAVFNDIDPNVKSGTELATDLNNFKASLLTQHSGASAPTYAEIGTEWLDSSVTDLLIKKGLRWNSMGYGIYIRYSSSQNFLTVVIIR
jgi:hypothetical protein